jgi:hypothetical protein
MLWPVLLSVALSFPVPPLAVVSPEHAAKTAKQAEELWRDGHYGEASNLLGKAYEEDPNPAYLYARASVENDAGHCDRVVELFEQFLATDPPEQDANAAREAMAPCKQKLDEQAAAEAEQAEQERLEQERLEQERLEQDKPDKKPDSDRPIRKDILGGVLMGAGAGVTVAGIGVLAAGLVTHGNAGDASTADGFVDESKRGRTMTGVGIGVLVVGVAVMTAGAIRYGLLARNKKRGDVAQRRRFRASIGPTGVGMRF